MDERTTSEIERQS